MWSVEGAGGSAASAKRGGERGGILLGELDRSPCRGKRGRAETEEAALRCGEPLGEPTRSVLHLPVDGQTPRELLGRLLRLELGELDLVACEQTARLELEECRDQDEELAAGVELEPFPPGEVGDERDHDLGQVDLGERELLAQDEGEQKVEGALERVEIELESADLGRRSHRAEASRASGRDCAGSPSAARPAADAACVGAALRDRSRRRGRAAATRRRTRSRRRSRRPRPRR